MPRQKKRAEQELDQTPHVIRSGGDEMNLVEYPFAALWSKDGDASSIEHSWETQHPISGRKVKASWRVTGDPDLGLPGPTDERLYLVLMELSRESGFSSQIVHFTRHDLIKRLRWSHDQHSYRMLGESLRRLKAVTISAENAFWDATIKSFRTVGFGILDNYDVVAERGGRKKKDGSETERPESFFRWNDVVFGSVQAGYIRALDLDFALSLKGDLALRLFRYLDKKAYDGRKTFEIELEVLCERHLGMKPMQYDSTRRARLKSAHDELLRRDFLRSLSFEPMKTRKAEKVCYVFTPRNSRSIEATEKKAEQSSLPEIPNSPQQTVLAGALQNVATMDGDGALIERMMEIGVSPDVARQLAATTTRNDLKAQLDCLSDRKATDPAAVLVKSIREKWSFPQAYTARLEAAERAEKAREAQEANQKQKSLQEEAQRAEDAKLKQEAEHLDAIYFGLDERGQNRIDEQVTERLGIVGRLTKHEGAKQAMRRQIVREMLESARQ